MDDRSRTCYAISAGLTPHHRFEGRAENVFLEGSVQYSSHFFSPSQYILGVIVKNNNVEFRKM